MPFSTAIRVDIRGRCCLAMLAAGAIGAAGCSVVFSESASGDDMRCGIGLEHTLAYFPVEGDEGSETLRTSDGLALGSVVKAKSNAYEPEELGLVGGPTIECGFGVEVTRRDEGDVIRFAHDAFASQDLEIGVKSVDFWFRKNAALPVEVESKSMATLLSKDAVGDHNGDLLVSVVGDDTGSSDRDHFVVMRIEHEDGDYLNCSNAIELNRWHHIAISLHQNFGATMLVDGIRATNTSFQVDHDIAKNNPCSDPAVMTLAQSMTFSDTENDWLWGGSNDRFEPNPGEGETSNPIRGAEPLLLDELRFRSKSFTAKEAEDVYNSLADDLRDGTTP